MVPNMKSKKSLQKHVQVSTRDTVDVMFQLAACSLFIIQTSVLKNSNASMISFCVRITHKNALMGCMQSSCRGRPLLHLEPATTEG